MRDWTTNQPFSGYPFAPALPHPGGLRYLIYPQAEYDPISGRLWMLYSENLGNAPEEFAFDCVPYVHMAVHKDPAVVSGSGVIDSLSNGQWWYYTGRTAEGTAGNAGVAFNFGDNNIDPFSGLFPVDHAPAEDTQRFPSMGFDERAVIVATGGLSDCSIGSGNAVGYDQYIYIIPRAHSGGTFVDGDRPPEDEFISINMTGRPLTPDASAQARVAQEPFEQYPNTTLMVSTLTLDSSTLQDSIRIKGVFFSDQGTPSDPTDDRWEVRQRLEQDPPASGNYELIDMNVATLGLGFFRPDFSDRPDAPRFSPVVEEDMFTSAVLTEDAFGNPRVFAVHAVLPDDGTGNPGDFWVVQWYVIDPDLGDFISAPIESELWRPAIVESGRIEVDEAHCYHPVLGVNDDGLMTIEYTLSSTTVDQQIRRARFDNSYNITSTTTLRTAPPERYTGRRWALYGDLQFDPVVGQGACDWLWSTHTLVEEAATANTDIRDVWLFRQNQSPFCFQTDLNQDGLTDSFDMMLYTDLHSAGDLRADVNADGRVDSIDMARYLDAYSAATGR